MVLAAVGQMTSTASMSHNLSQALALITKATTAGARALFLPEAADYIASSPQESVSICRSVKDSEFVKGLCEAARKHKLPISVGVHEPGESKDKVKNTLLWIDEQGEIAQRYQKLHLFDVQLKNGTTMKESQSVEAGNEMPKVFDSVVGKIGYQICFDLRFPEPALALSNKGAQIITYPSAFATQTGKMHWKPLLTARAIETESYIIAAAQVGYHNQKRSSYGHSMIIDPWGHVQCELLGVESGPHAEPSIAVANIDLDIVKSVREEIPLARRTDVYPEL